ncbi:adenylate kinase [Stenotrophomonas sp. T8]|uniref:deoxynucleotide monophosphate kinase family protein n=1 Tax=Stenotrophomonas sp. T8 TaxID=3446365 RepID=UPI003F6F2579
MKIIGITGRARSGKDTLAEFLVSDHGFVKLSFAAPIRAFVADITGLPVSAMEDGPLKEEPLDWLNGQTPRRLMQTVGTEWGREMIDRDLWVKVVAQKIRQARRDGAAGVVVSDVRFDNEAQFIREWGGQVVQVLRDSAAPVSAHASEAGVQGDLIDTVIDNNGPVHRLRQAAEALVRL